MITPLNHRLTVSLEPVAASEVEALLQDEEHAIKELPGYTLVYLEDREDIAEALGQLYSVREVWRFS